MLDTAEAPVFTPAYRRLEGVTLATVRGNLSPGCYRRSPARALGWWAFDLALYLAAIAGVFTSASLPAKLGFGLLTGLAVACMFVWAHDAAHGALFRGKRVAEILGTTLMLPSLNMYRLWQFGHNRVHHGFTSLSTIDWIWRPLTPEEYTQLGRGRRVAYRCERSLAGCGLHYFVQVWWKGMIRFAPDPKLRQRRSFLLSKALTGTFVAVASIVAFLFGGGLAGVACAVVVPFAVFTYVIALFVYLHHTHPDIPFFNARRDWRASVAQIHCSTVIRCSRVTELLTHRILVHVPHHVDSRIPFYNLERAYADLAPAYGDLIHEYRFRWATVRDIFRRCKLYDFDEHRWYTFEEAAALPPAAVS